MIYIAGPFSHENPAVVYARATVHVEAAVTMLRMGLSVYSPIASWWQISKDYGLSTCPLDWETHNRDMVLRADVLRVIDLPGVDESVGTSMEKEWARLEGIPVEIYSPDHLKNYQHFYKTLRA